MSTISIKLEFGGGMDLLFDNKRTHRIDIPAVVPIDNSTDLEASPDSEPKETKPVDVDYLIHHMRDHMLKERVELFMEKGTVRPGILVLINDTDWELEGEGECQLKNGDEVVFISTLHGGTAQIHPVEIEYPLFFLIPLEGVPIALFFQEGSDGRTRRRT